MSNFFQVYLLFNGLLVLFLIPKFFFGSLNTPLFKNWSNHQLVKLMRLFFTALIITTIVYSITDIELNIFDEKLNPYTSVTSPIEHISDFVEAAELPVALPVIQEASPLKINLVNIIVVGILIKAALYIKNLISLYKIVSSSVLWRNVGRCKVMFSDQISTPFSTCVFLKKQVLLPYSLLDSPKNLRIAIRHEVLHHKNGDLQWTLIMDLLKLICFWNPAVYYWKNQLDCLQEYACDEAVLGGKKELTTAEYVQCLLDVATFRGKNYVSCSNMAIGFSIFSKRKKQLKRRVKMITNLKKHSESRLTTTAKSLSICALTIIATACVYAQDSNRLGYEVNGQFIDMDNGNEDENREHKQDIYSTVSQKDGESLEEYALRVASLYVKSQELIDGLNKYATGMEETWSEQSEKIAELETRLQGVEVARGSESGE